MSQRAYAHLLAAADGLSAELRDVIARLGPLSLPRRDGLGVAHFLARAVVGQQLSTKAARTIWQRVEATARSLGEEIPAVFVARHAEALRGCGVSTSKVKALIAIREAERAGRLDQAVLRAMDHAARTRQLTAIWGIGPWTCDMLAIFHCGDRDVWPEGDLAVQRTFRRYIGRRSPSRAARLFSPYRSYLALYLWRSLDAEP